MPGRNTAGNRSLPVSGRSKWQSPTANYSAGRSRRVEATCYGDILGAYREHPEADFLGHDGNTVTDSYHLAIRRSMMVEGGIPDRICNQRTVGA